MKTKAISTKKKETYTKNQWEFRMISKIKNIYSLGFIVVDKDDRK